MKPVPDLTIFQRAVLERIPALGLPSSARILDAPCGNTGALTRALREQGFEAVGADIDLEAKEHLGDAFVKANLDAAFPWSNGSFDTVISTEGIEHLENHFFFFREVHRVLKPRGLFALTTPNISGLRSRVRFLGSSFFGRDARPLDEAGRHPLNHISLATFPELRYELRVSGFRLVEVRHTHIKPVSYLYSIYVPWIWLYTLLAFRKEKDPAQRERNKEIRAALLSPSLLFGENVLLVTKKL